MTQIPTETEDDISDLNQSASFQKLNTFLVNLLWILRLIKTSFFLDEFLYIEITDQPN